MEAYKPNKMLNKFTLSDSLSALLCEARESYGEYKGYLKSMSFDYKLLLPNMIINEIYHSFKIDGSKLEKENMFYFQYYKKSNEITMFNNMTDVFLYGLSNISKNELSCDTLNKMNKLMFKDCKKDATTKGSGHFRKKQTYILKPGIAGSSVSFIPPVYSDIKTYMDDLCNYYNDNKDDAFISTALTHLQFEKLHPYISNNGYLGRILSPILISSKKNEPPILFLSESIFKLKNTYFNSLSSQVEDKDQFIKLFLDCIVSQCNDNIKKIKKLNKTYNNDYNSFKTIIGGTTIYKVYPSIIKRIVFTTADIVNDTNLHINSVNKVLNKLVESGYLIKEKKDKANRVTFTYKNMYDILID